MTADPMPLPEPPGGPPLPLHRGCLVWVGRDPVVRLYGVLAAVGVHGAAVVVVDTLGSFMAQPGSWGRAEPTPAMRRVMQLLLGGAEQTGVARWVPLACLDRCGLLDEDDVVCVPGLVERGLLDHDAALGAVRLTDLGAREAAGW